MSIKWFEDGTLNVAANCVDRHLATRGDQTAIIWEPDDPNEPAQHITYRELHDAGRASMANVLKDLGVGKGDRVVLYLPMIPEAAYAMLACARHRRDPFDRLRRLLARRAGQPRSTTATPRW